MDTNQILDIIMIGVGFILIYLAIKKGMEPTLLLPMGFGAILVNLPGSVMLQDNAILQWLYNVGIESAEAFPLLLFIGIGAMIDFGRGRTGWHLHLDDPRLPPRLPAQ